MRHCTLLLLLLLLPALCVRAATPRTTCLKEAPDYYYWNELTGEVQWDDPGDVAYEDEFGNLYWLASNGVRMREDSSIYNYVWVEQYSEELRRPYFYNQETRESTWERPADLAWQRVRTKAGQ